MENDQEVVYYHILQAQLYESQAYQHEDFSDECAMAAQMGDRKTYDIYVGLVENTRVIMGKCEQYFESHGMTLTDGLFLLVKRDYEL